MYRLLEVGEVIEKGDEYYNGDKWLGFPSACIGMKTVPHDAPIRRLVNPAVTPIPCKADPWHVSNCHSTPAASSVPDPGEGYRLIDKSVDKPEPGDEYWDASDRTWTRRSCDTLSFRRSDIYRRKLPAVPAVDPGEGWRLLKEGETIIEGDQITTGGNRWFDVSSGIGNTIDCYYSGNGKWSWRRRVAPVVSVGDRVKVLSGPWAGCTGVVTLLDKWNRWNTDVYVQLENVRVGGERLGLVLPIREVELLPPVVPEVLYRDLSHGETIRKGDEYLTALSGEWVVRQPDLFPVTIGRFHVRHRRPIRLQSPGWRYLDAGETVQAGDEVWSGLFNRYVPASADRGSVVNDEKLFRRKLPANQGG